jgi:hypothetical protein
MKKAQIKISWIVYPPNYKPGDSYIHVPFLRDAWNKACSMGEGASLDRLRDVKRKDGSGSWEHHPNYYVVEVVKR